MMQEMPVRSRFWMWGAVALACGLALRLVFAHLSPWVTGDVLIYGAIAKVWLQTGGYGFTAVDGHAIPTLIRLPGMPLFDAVCFKLFGIEHYRAIINVQILLDLGGCLMLAALAGKVAGRKAGLIGLWISALCPFVANYTQAPLTETLTILTTTLAFYSLVRWRERGLGWNRWLYITAFAMSYSILLRPEQGLLPAAIMPAMLWMQWRAGLGGKRGLITVVPALVAALLVVAPLGPWAYRNWKTFHVFQPLAPRFANDPGEIVARGFETWYATWALDFNSTEEVYWNYDGNIVDLNNIPKRVITPKVVDLMARYNDQQSNSPDLDAEWAQLNLERRHQHPIESYLVVPFVRVLDMWLRPRTEMMPVPLEWWQWHHHKRTALFAFCYAALNLAYLLLAFVGVRRWMRKRRSNGESPLGTIGAAALAFVLLRCLLLMTVDNSEPRYTLECWPMVIVMAAVGLTAVCCSKSAGPRISKAA